MAGNHYKSVLYGDCEGEGKQVADWGIDRGEFDFIGLDTPLSVMTGQLAESWSQPDPLTYIVKVRQGVHWHNKPPMNGRELTAQDIEYNFHRVLGMGSGFTEVAEVIAGASVLTNVSFESITATDDSTVLFKLKEPFLGAARPILDDPVNYIYPPEVIKEHGDATDWRNLVGTGPFMLTDWVEGSSLTWTQNPDYWGFDEKYSENRLPYADEVRTLIMPEEATYLAALRSGRVDYIGDAGSSAIRSVDQAVSLERTNPDIILWTKAGVSTSSVGLNTSKPPFDDVRVCKAMQMALDGETINNSFFKGYAGVTPYGMIGPSAQGITSHLRSGQKRSRKATGMTRKVPSSSLTRLDTRAVPAESDSRPHICTFRGTMRVIQSYSLRTGVRLALMWRFRYLSWLNSSRYEKTTISK